MTIILFVHILLMLASLIATSAMAVAAATSHIVNINLIKWNFTATTAGVACGIALIFSRPLDVKCIILFSYVVAFAASYIFIARRNQSLVRLES